MSSPDDLPGDDQKRRPTFRYWGGAAIIGPLIAPLIPDRVRNILWVRAIKAFSREMRNFTQSPEDATKKPTSGAE